MTKSMIDEVKELLALTETELDEILLSEKYNKANLRELVRRCLQVANEYKIAFEYEISEAKKETEESLKRYSRE
ncbi:MULTISPECIES: hypothetical protein [unclassified Psychrobacillus]|uniref:hypothetical protein n=1 Tax=unclassified Psychrobacillus TaxID=2636677 RepID=UPI0030F6970D